jgi:hypothetical protein
MRKLSYESSSNKKAVQKKIYLQYKGIKKVIGLGGPNLTEYLLFLKSMGIKQADIYEFDAEQLLLQINNYVPVINSQIYYGDILRAVPNKTDTLYDLDFCCCILSAKKHIEKFTTNSIITLSIRPYGLEQTIEKFCQYIDSTSTYTVDYHYNHTENYKVYRIDVGKKKYLCYSYRDTTPMITLQSI